MKQQLGISMIEVLIALVVFAIGVGGMAGLQLRSMSMSVDATQRAVVLAKSQELADRIRSNTAGMSTYINTFNNNDQSYCAARPVEMCSDSSAGDAVSCNEIQMARFDLWDVFCEVPTGLNSSVIQWNTDIACTSSTCDGALDTVTITTTWVSKTSDSNKDLASTTSAAITEQLILSFVP